jgi:hypothetical protein
VSNLRNLKGVATQVDVEESVVAMEVETKSEKLEALLGEPREIEYLPIHPWGAREFDA